MKAWGLFALVWSASGKRKAQAPPRMDYHPYLPGETWEEWETYLKAQAQKPITLVPWVDYHPVGKW